jgi:hypothetical protein
MRTVVLVEVSGHVVVCAVFWVLMERVRETEKLHVQECGYVKEMSRGM